MKRSQALRLLGRHFKTALLANRLGIPSQEAIDRLSRLSAEAREKDLSRRKFLGTAGKALTAAAFASTLGPWRQAFAARKTPSSLSVGIVGAGLAGLTAARELKNAGLDISLYDAGSRVGGRVWSLSNKFPGQVAERGGEVFYRFMDQDYSESEVVDQYRQFVATMQDDLRGLSGEISALTHTEEDRRLDLISIDEYLDGNNSSGTPAGDLLREVIRVAYTIEYGLETHEQSSINFLQFIHADKRSQFKPWGIFSDERYHIVGGNDQITSRLADELTAETELGMSLTRVSKGSDGRITLTFRSGNRTVTRTHDRVILAIPFSTLRNVELQSSLALPAWKTDAIRDFCLGANTKHMIGFNGRPWASLGGNGASYSDLVDLQATWETNVSQSTARRAILTDYSGGDRALSLKAANAQSEAEKFLNALETVFPGSKAFASRSGEKYITHLENWATNPLALGGYTCYKPGQFTSIAGLEGIAVDNLHFAGEHTDSFYSWQGFMEGACLSGLRTAAEVLDS